MDGSNIVMRKVTGKGKVNGFEASYALVMLGSMLCMCCMNKGISLNLDLMLSSNYVMIMIMLMFIYVYMNVCMLFSDKVIIVLF